MRITVCGFVKANSILKNGKSDIDVVISILDPIAWPAKQPNGLSFIKNVLEIQFDDVEKEHSIYECPTMEDAQKIVDFVDKALAEGNKNWLIHCHYGKSRSTATTMLLLSKVSGLDTVKDELLKLAPKASPNILLCAHFDKICGYGNVLEECAKTFDYVALKTLAQGD